MAVLSFSPHYIGSSFSTNDTIAWNDLPPFLFQSPLYRVFFFNLGSKKRLYRYHHPFQSPLYRVFFFNLKSCSRISLYIVCFSPHYIGSSFSTFSPLHQAGSVFCFSPHYIGSSFSTYQLIAGPEDRTAFQSPLYRVFFFNKAEENAVKDKKTVSVPIISGLLFQQMLTYGVGGLFNSFSPHYIGSSFSTPLPSEGLK